jgi:hypothetical protein
LDVLGSVNITDNQVGANSLVINVPTGVGAGNFLSATANRGLDYAIRMENQNTGGSVSNKMRVGSSDFTMRLYQISGDNRGGWDGWIALSGVKIQLKSASLAANPAPAFISGCTSSNCANGAAWGSDVVGWIDFSGVTTMEQKLSCTGSYGTVIPDGSNFTFYSAPDADGNCTTQEKECKNGVLTPNSASFTELSCGNTKKDCTRGGKTFKDGDKVIFYAKAIAGIGQTCNDIKAELTCTDGKFYDEKGNEDTGITFKNLKCINNPSYIER